MSPRSRFQSCGSSSRLRRRSTRPTRVTLGSRRNLNIGSGSSSSRSSSERSAPTCIVRNLNSLNGAPLSPARLWTKKTGPRSSSQIASAISGNSSAATSASGIPTIRSRARFSIIVERETSVVTYSNTGSSASREMLCGVAWPRSGETRLSFASWRAAEVGDHRDLARVDALVRQHDPVDAARHVAPGSTASMCRSLNSASLRRIAWARPPLPTTSTCSGGVVARQAARAATRSSEVGGDGDQRRPTASSPVVERAGRGELAEQARPRPCRSRPRRTIAGASSTVRWRSARWSAS